jgi:TolB-like protein/Tfp pilus assembly protein PilF
VPDEEALGYFERWREAAPTDLRVHKGILAVLGRLSRFQDGEKHLDAVLRLFRDEGLDDRPLRQAWRDARLAVSRPDGTAETAPVDLPPRGGCRSICVMPFAEPQVGLGGSGTGGALAHDVITRLARLRTLFVIAQGTVFALHQRGVSAAEAARLLDVDYVVNGSVQEHGSTTVVAVELVETKTHRLLWSETFTRSASDTLLVLESIGTQIVSCVVAEVESLERGRAVLTPPNSLDAWGAYHRGLWHMYRYRKSDNSQAREFFERSLALDPSFARAHAGLAFTHFQDAFQNWDAREPNIVKAYEAAAQAVLADERDPTAHWALGRSLFLRCQWDEAETEFEHSVQLSPNFALGHYNLSFLRALVRDPVVAMADADLSRELSPYDPMLFGMLATRAMSLVRLGRFEEAAGWAVKAASRPNAFAHIHALAAYTLALAGSPARAGRYAAAARREAPRYAIGDFLLTFPFEPDGEALFRRGAHLVGMS